MRFVPRESIIVSDNRQRKAHDPVRHVELMNSIKQVGLLHPVIVRASGETLVLVAGERRLRALADIEALGGHYAFESKEVPLNHAPCVELGELSPLDAEEAELDENVRRLDLTWQERARATSRLHSLRVAKSESRGEVLHTVADTALELRGSSEGRYQEDTRREILIARHLEDPEVAKAASADDAFKLLRRREDTQKNVELAARIGAVYSADAHRLFNQDCLGWLSECPAETFDVILTDPPYGMGADEFGDSGQMKMQAHGYDDSYEAWSKLMTELPYLLYRIAKPQAHLYAFCDLDNYHEFHAKLYAVGWRVHRTPLIWHKPNGSRAPWPAMGPKRQWEMVLYAVKGDRPAMLLASDVITQSNEPQMQHGAQKPIELFKELLRRSARPGDSVCDPFCGTGTIFPAAHALKLYATGIEADPATYAIATKRLGKLKEKP